MTIQHQCPLCRNPAQYEPVGFPAPRRHYLCSSCGEFVIEETGERVLAGYASQFRSRLSDEARKTVGEYVYVISVGRRQDRTEVDAEPVIRIQALR